MDFVREQIDQLKHVWENKRAFAFQGLNLAMVVLTALMIWKGLMVITHSESPVVVVLSGSMEPAMFKGDILFLDNRMDHLEIGDIVVFKVREKEIPIVHRILEARDLSTGERVYLSKGDNNWGDDRSLYAPGQVWLKREDVLGRAVGFVPYVGHVTILLNENPMVKFGLLGIMALFALTGKD